MTATLLIGLAIGYLAGLWSKRAHRKEVEEAAFSEGFRLGRETGAFTAPADCCGATGGAHAKSCPRSARRLFRVLDGGSKR